MRRYEKFGGMNKSGKNNPDNKTSKKTSRLPKEKDLKEKSKRSSFCSSLTRRIGVL